MGPPDALHLLDRLEHLQGLFDEVPGLPMPSQIDHLLIVVRPDLTATAWVNELDIRAKVQVNRAVAEGEEVRVADVQGVVSVQIGVEVPDDAAVVVVRSLGWKRSLFFDFGPLAPGGSARSFLLEQALAQQALLLMGLPLPGEAGQGGATRAERMADGLKRFVALLERKSEEERDYQELFEEHPWMFGSHYTSIDRHRALDDKRIPDFTGERSWDACLDILEIKQPFLKCFKQDGGFSAAFNDAWNQSEEYLAFTARRRGYLQDEKGLRFENPQCFLVIGYGWSAEQRSKVQNKVGISRSVRVLSYDQVLKIAEHVYGLMRSAGDRILTVY